TLAKFVLKGYALGPLIWARYFIHLLFMLVLFGPRMRLNLVRTKRPGIHILRGLLLVGSTAFFYLSLMFLPLAEAAAISFVGPVLTTVLSGRLLNERISVRQWVAVVLGFVGVLIIIRPDGGVFTPAVVFPLLTAIAFSLYQIATRKIAGRENPVTTLFYTALVGAVVTSIGLPITWVTPLWWQVALMVAIGFFGGFGHFLLIRAVEHASPMALAPFVYTQLIWSTLLAWIVFNEFPDHGTLTGMGVIIAAGLLAVNWDHMRRRTDATNSAQGH
ncbi:MAG: DMT family transporter, partial [Burkholderiales bacterium]|nr:DMT family transporter [Burkholderiales bacterium]